MYSGYRLKINGMVFPNRYISQGTYNAVSAKRVVEVWTDASFVEEEITTGTTKAVISFNIIEHDSAEHSAIVSFLQKDDQNDVEYYDDRTDRYKSIVCRLEPISFSHRNTYGGKIQYNETSITLIEN